MAIRREELNSGLERFMDTMLRRAGYRVGSEQKLTVGKEGALHFLYGHGEYRMEYEIISPNEIYLRVEGVPLTVCDGLIQKLEQARYSNKQVNSTRYLKQMKVIKGDGELVVRCLMKKIADFKNSNETHNMHSELLGFIIRPVMRAVESAVDSVGSN